MSTATTTTGTETSQAETLLRAILRVDLLRVTVQSMDRSIARTEQAALTRKLFRSLGIRGVSVTAPSYSMAQSTFACPAVMITSATFTATSTAIAPLS